MIMPLVLIMVVLYAYPVVYSVYLSLTSFNYAVVDGSPEWVGLENFATFFSSSEGRQVIRNTFTFTLITVSIETVIGLLLALAFNRVFAGKGIARALILVPVMLAPKLYIVDAPIPWITSATFAMPSLIIADVWYATPFMAIILMGGLQSLPEEPYESAIIDGATAFQRFWYITLPLLRPVLLAAVLIRTMDAFQTFDLVFILTYGGPGNLTELLNTFTYKTSFLFFKLGYASAVSVTSLIIMVILSLILLRVIRRIGYG
jgi:multiple sugar transport system permease protein